ARPTPAPVSPVLTTEKTAGARRSSSTSRQGRNQMERLPSGTLALRDRREEWRGRVMAEAPEKELPTETPRHRDDQSLEDVDEARATAITHSCFRFFSV